MSRVGGECSLCGETWYGNIHQCRTPRERAAARGVEAAALPHDGPQCDACDREMDPDEPETDGVCMDCFEALDLGCQMCGGDEGYMGRLADLFHFRCMSCGMDRNIAVDFATREED